MDTYIIDNDANGIDDEKQMIASPIEKYINNKWLLEIDY